MGYQIKTKAIVLHEMPIGDYDKRLILLTKEEGKITAFVKGARRSNNKMLACSQVFSYGEFILFKGKSSYNVTEAQLIEPFHNLRYDIEDLTYGLYLLEFVEFVAHESQENVEIMRLLLYALKVMNDHHIKPNLVIRIFELKAMDLLGFTPWVNDCVVCHKATPIRYFSSEQGGILCDDQKHNFNDKMRLQESTVYTLRYILSRPMKDIFSFELETSALLDFERLMNHYVDSNLNKKFKSLNFLKTL
jgi:DNA repair protein RecO (recombination protein O)